jgi:hypothetical protein
MKPARKRRLAMNTVLLLICGGLAAAIYFELGSRAPLARLNPDADTGGAVAFVAPAGFSLPPRAEFSEFVERPLFLSERRPFIDPLDAEVAAPAPVKPLGLLLTGVIISPDERAALMERPGRRDIVRVAEGEVIDGWKVSSIGPDRVVLHNGEVEEILVLRDSVKLGKLRAGSGQQNDRRNQAGLPARSGAD